MSKPLQMFVAMLIALAALSPSVSLAAPHPATVPVPEGRAPASGTTTTYQSILEYLGGLSIADTGIRLESTSDKVITVRVDLGDASRFLGGSEGQTKILIFVAVALLLARTTSSLQRTLPGPRRSRTQRIATRRTDAT